MKKYRRIIPVKLGVMLQSILEFIGWKNFVSKWERLEVPVIFTNSNTLANSSGFDSRHDLLVFEIYWIFTSPAARLLYLKKNVNFLGG